MKTYQINNNIKYGDLGNIKQSWDFDPREVNEEFLEEQALDIIKDQFNIYNPDETLINYIIKKEELESIYVENERDNILEDFEEEHNFNEVYKLCGRDIRGNYWIDSIKEFDNKYLLAQCGAGNSTYAVVLEIVSNYE